MYCTGQRVARRKKTELRGKKKGSEEKKRDPRKKKWPDGAAPRPPTQPPPVIHWLSKKIDKMFFERKYFLFWKKEKIGRGALPPGPPVIHWLSKKNGVKKYKIFM